jgi:putative Holliday junction resolvase
MGRIMALDFGSKRCGLAVTDPLQIIATPLTTVETAKLQDFFDEYLKNEIVDCLVIGEPVRNDGTPTQLEEKIQKFIETFQKKHSSVQIERQDEAYSSQKATEAIRFSVKSRKKRQDKSLIDKVSAFIILQEYMGWSL